MTVGNGVLTPSALDVEIFVLAFVEEDGSIGVWSVAGRLASSALFFSCCTYARNRKSSAQASATVFQNRGSICGVCTKVWGESRNIGFCILHIPNSSCFTKDVAIDSRASATSVVVIIGGGIVDVVIVTIGNS